MSHDLCNWTLLQFNKKKNQTENIDSAEFGHFWKKSIMLIKSAFIWSKI